MSPSSCVGAIWSRNTGEPSSTRPIRSSNVASTCALWSCLRSGGVRPHGAHPTPWPAPGVKETAGSASSRPWPNSPDAENIDCRHRPQRGRSFGILRDAVAHALILEKRTYKFTSTARSSESSAVCSKSVTSRSKNTGRRSTAVKPCVTGTITMSPELRTRKKRKHCAKKRVRPLEFAWHAIAKYSARNCRASASSSERSSG